MGAKGSIAFHMTATVIVGADGIMSAEGILDNPAIFFKKPEGANEYIDIVRVTVSLKVPMRI